MRIIIFTVFAFTVIITACAQTYTDRFDNINIDEVLSNKRLVVAYIKCALTQGRCTAEGSELKGHIVDALQTGCTKCTQIQRKGVGKVLKYLIKNETDYWKQLVEKYDPDSVYRKTYEKEYEGLVQ